ncbi:hypothetical protein OIE13_22705 [Streptosporangium sp. NBC_01810]|uniref:hypothetical protein n=1 Tax=Streptosporangium sp. NBC_01810 TaxID=2975951 RepID=UPI002DDA7AD3|nr:hypothetical protein [Streptosporangium sp. NBC_01810]WSA23756.1 hypothetical protein OIE13_22705 [Streptosporangium sp. NBC_01810]
MSSPLTPPTPQGVADFLTSADNSFREGLNGWPSLTAKGNVVEIKVTPTDEDGDEDEDNAVHFRAVVVEGEQTPIVFDRATFERRINERFDNAINKLGFAAPEMWPAHIAALREQILNLDFDLEAAQSDTGDTLIRITADEAVAAITAAAHKVTDDLSPDWGRTLIHGMVAGHGMGAGMRVRWDLHNAIHEVRKASSVAWTDDPSGHEMTIHDDKDRPLIRFNVKRPTSTGEAETR